MGSLVVHRHELFNFSHSVLLVVFQKSPTPVCVSPVLWDVGEWTRPYLVSTTYGICNTFYTRGHRCDPVALHKILQNQSTDDCQYSHNHSLTFTGQRWKIQENPKCGVILVAVCVSVCRWTKNTTRYLRKDWYFQVASSNTDGGWERLFL